MALSLDAEYLKAIEPYLTVLENVLKYAIGDVQSRRDGGEGLFDLLMPAWPEVNDVQQKSYVVKSKDGGYDIPLVHFTRTGTDTFTPGPAVLYVHGGGYLSLSNRHYRKVLEAYVSQSGIPLVAVDYRLAPEFPYPILVEDCYTALMHFSQNAATFNVDAARITVSGDSAGGGLGAGLAFKAGDQGLSPPLAKQMLIGSMLDDRSTASKNEALASFATWSHEDNVTGWSAYLGSPDIVNSSTIGAVSPYAAASRVESTKGLPSLYLGVPDLDVYRDENVAYAQRIAAENIETEVHIWKGLPHSFELFQPNIETTKIALMCRVKAMRSF